MVLCLTPLAAPETEMLCLAGRKLALILDTRSDRGVGSFDSFEHSSSRLRLFLSFSLLRTVVKRVWVCVG